jgi:hypothetical protein
MRVLVALFALFALIALAHSKGKDPAKSWTWNAGTAKIDPKSSVLMKTMMTYALPRPAVLVMNKWGVAMATASAKDPYYSVKVLKSGRLDKKLRIPLGTKPNKSPDAALTIYDPISGREHDMWRAKFNPKTGRIVSAVMAASFPAGNDHEMDVDGQMGGANLGNVPLRRGLVTPEDLARGRIDQALQMAMPEVGHGKPRFPAIYNIPRRAHGQRNNDVGPNRLVCGTWLRLNPSINVEALPIQPWEKVIGRTLQEHGMIFRDYARTLIIYGKDTSNGGMRWIDAGIKPGKSTPAGEDAKAAEFSRSFPWNQLQILRPPKHKHMKYKPKSPSSSTGTACSKTCLKMCKKQGAKGCPKLCKKKCAKNAKKKMNKI